MKKALSLILCLVLVLSMSATVFAEDTTHTLTINNPVEGHNYEAYQIFSGTLETVAGTDKQVLTNIEWGVAIVGEGYDHSAALLADIQAAATAAEAGAPLKKLLGVTDAATLAEAMADNVTTDSESLDALAAIFAKHVESGRNTGNCTYTKNITTGEDGKEVDKSYYTISGLTPGYYLVKDQDNSLSGEYDSYTKFILRVIKDETVAPKSSVPSVEKTVNDTLDGTYTEHEDFDINDTVYYKWVGKLPSNLKDYETYYYKFFDTMPTGIEFIQFEQVYLEGHDGNVVHSFYNAADENPTWPAGLNAANDGKNLSLEFVDLHELYPSVLPTQKIVVKYSARVTRDALIADPMTNKVYVEFSNNPNDDGEGTYPPPTGKTPEDPAHAFTFQINVDKYDADNKEKKLEGAEFVLYYERTENDQIVKYYAQVITEEMIAAGTVINGTAVDANDLGVVYGWTTDETQASVLDTDANGSINIKGLDSGIYYLKETKAPAGYNLMETPVKIEIIPKYNENGDEVSVTVSYKVDDIAQDSNTVGVRNSSGSTLPVTGGIGTTIFYILGSVLFIGAAVLLIARKRMTVEA
ncbi:MAG: isopeptide-forming domain-containing fimbrial protein [Ruminococcaceae bacterium]|nr:isopeptide-forming domain-containing fimbrial protein [Oscillospiraceae bacterium]